MPAIEGIARHVEGQVEHATESALMLHDKRRFSGVQACAPAEDAEPVDVHGAGDVERGGEGALECICIDARHSTGQAGQERRQARSSKQRVIRSARDCENSSLGDPLDQRFELGCAQALQGHAVQHDRGHGVVSPPVNGQQLRVRVEHPQALGSAVVEVVKIGVPAEHQKQAPGGEARAQIDLGSRQLPPARVHADHQRMGEPLHEHGKRQGLAGIPIEFQLAPVGDHEVPAAQFVAAGDLYLQLAVQVLAMVGHGDAQGRPAPRLEGVGKPRHRVNLDVAGGHRLWRRTQ